MQKLDLYSGTNVTEGRNGDLVFSFEGANSKLNKIAVEVSMCTWQFNQLVEQVAKIHVLRIQRAQREKDDFKNSALKHF